MTAILTSSSFFYPASGSLSFSIDFHACPCPGIWDQSECRLSSFEPPLLLIKHFDGVPIFFGIGEIPQFISSSFLQNGFLFPIVFIGFPWARSVRIFTGLFLQHLLPPHQNFRRGGGEVPPKRPCQQLTGAFVEVLLTARVGEGPQTGAGGVHAVQLHPIRALLMTGGGIFFCNSSDFIEA